MCRSWRRELEARGVCSKTAQLCSTLAESGDIERLRQNAQQRLDASFDEERAICLDADVFLQRRWGVYTTCRGGSLHDWLQAASQEPAASFLSRGAVSTAQVLGLPLVQWVGKPQELDPVSYTLAKHSRALQTIAFSPDGKLVTSSSKDALVKIWNAQTGAEVIL